MTITSDAINIIISTIAIVISIITAMKNHTISRENTRLANAGIELEMRNMISESRRYLADISVKFTPYLDKRDKLNPDEISLYDAISQQYDEAVENLINSYEELCMKYIDGKIDKDRFKKNFIKELRNLVTHAELRSKFDSHSSPYTAIIKVYNEWENLEK